MTTSSHIWCPHVTVATIVRDSTDRFLMVEETIHGKQRYNQPAGHLEPNETLVKAAVRETLEETGYEVQPEQLIGIYQWFSPLHRDHVVRFVFYAHILAHHPQQPLDKGIERALWLTREEIKALGERLRGPLILASIDDFNAGERLPLNAIKSLLPAGNTP